MFAKKRNSRRRFTINITPLIDVLFLLLIFFMVSSTFVEKPGIEVTLPQAKTAALNRADDTIVTIEHDGTMYFNAEKIQHHELSNRLAQVQLKNINEPIILQADENVAYKTVVFVMDTARQLGFSNIISLTLHEGTPPANE
ncbi:MAG: biopolymer transporter ExbD [Candidatus Auribacterota bacterium]|nr:biopolymer transporter ExbD [Candidatus Auribacterota bacterium]